LETQRKSNYDQQSHDRARSRKPRAWRFGRALWKAFGEALGREDVRGR
jgi:hypothetical protein